MKKLVIIFLLITSFAKAQNFVSIEAPQLNSIRIEALQQRGLINDDTGILFADVSFWRGDLQYHAFGSGAFSFTFYLYHRGNLGKDRIDAIFSSAKYTFLVGFTKELHDEFLGTNGFNMEDMGANFIGMVGGILLADWLYEMAHPNAERLRKKANRKERRKLRKIKRSEL